MRGKQFGHLTDVGFFGLIPAHAGKTGEAIAAAAGEGAHPRACGENLKHFDNLDIQRGSSPRMRGKLTRFTADDAGPGLIPAHAGKTTPASDGRGFPRAHPRACGENDGDGCRCPKIAGSSPRMRGKPGRNRWRRSRHGLIPAHAGKTPPLLLLLENNRAHPRACGENRSPAPMDIRQQGSSPRMRGKPCGVSQDKCCGGLIPAHAGKTTCLA